MLEHVKKLLKIPGSKLLFGGEALKNHSIPSIYGAFKPTAVYVPIEEILKDKSFELVTREIFGPFQVRLVSPTPAHLSVDFCKIASEIMLYAPQ